jgi:hypothetical protein
MGEIKQTGKGEANEDGRKEVDGLIWYCLRFHMT